MISVICNIWQEMANRSVPDSICLEDRYTFDGYGFIRSVGTIMALLVLHGSVLGVVRKLTRLYLPIVECCARKLLSRLEGDNKYYRIIVQLDALSSEKGPFHYVSE